MYGCMHIKVVSPAGIRQPYLRVVGLEVDEEGTGRNVTARFTAPEEESFRQLAADPNIYDRIARSIAPSIYGSLDIKKSIACLLFGGSRKRFVSFVVVLLGHPM